MIREAQIAFVRAEALRIFGLLLDSSAAYYGAEYKSAAQMRHLDEGAALSSATRELETIYGLMRSRPDRSIADELSASIEAQRGEYRDRVVAILRDVLARLPREAIAA